MWLFPYLTYITIIGIVAILIAMAFIDSMRSQLSLTLLIAILVVGSFFLIKNKRENKAANSEINNPETVR